MNLADIRKLSPEQAMQAAAEDLALPTAFFDRMWKQESGRGQNMRSRAGAEGHFQQMPATRTAWEQRHKTSLNPDDFHDGLFMAYETMRENIAKFKDPIDATRAYNGGWKPAKWKNPETIGYVNAIWGNTAADGKAPSEARPEDWPSLPALPKGKGVQPHENDDATMIRIGTSSGQQATEAGSVDASRKNFEAGQAAAAKVQTRKEANSGVGAVFTEAIQDPRVMPTWAVLEKYGQQEPDLQYDYMARRDKIEAGMSDAEREYLRENAISEPTEQRALAELEFRRGVDQTYSDAGGLNAFTGQMAAGVTDPGSLVLGLGVAKAFQLARVGSAALAASGRGGAAAASMMAENAAANLAVEGVADAMGEVKTSADYALAAATGAAIAAPFTRGVLRQAHEAEIRNLARGVQERAAHEQISAITAVKERDPSLSPEQVARHVERDEAEAITRAVDEHSSPRRQDPVIPEDVRKAMEDEFNGIEPQPALKSAKERPEVDTPIEEVTPADFIEQLRKGEVTRTVKDTSGQTIKLSWSPEPGKMKGHGTLGETLAAIQTHPGAAPIEKRLAKYLTKVMSEDGLGIDIRFTAREARSNFDPGVPNVNIHGGGSSGIAAGATELDLATKVHSLTPRGLYQTLHEIVHAATYHRINAWEKSAGKLRADQQKILSQFQDLFDRFQTEVGTLGKGDKNSGARYAAKDLHEFAAQFYTDRETRFVLGVMEGKPVAGRSSSALAEFVGLIKRILGLTGSHGKSAFEEGSKLIDQIIAMPLDNVKHGDGSPVFAAADPGAPQGKLNPMIAMRSRINWAEKMVTYAESYMRQNPIDMARLNVMTAKIGGVSDGLVLAGSKNPVLQLVASLVTETTTGAAGRKANVAIRSKMLHSKFVGNTMIDYDAAYTVFRNRNGGGIMEDAIRGNVRRKFDQTVFEEVHSRRRAEYTPNADKSVVEAADALEGLFERARIGQVDAAVLGWGNLPGNSKGYLPQALDGVKLQAAGTRDLALLHDALARQFQERLGWDEKFAKDFAPFYTERARRRSQGDKGIEGLGAGGEGLQLVRDTLEEMQGDPSMLDRARAAASTTGMGQTKKRLDLDMMQELRPGLRMMDFFNTNPLLLARSYAKRTAGTVSLTEAGIHGIRGVRELRQAALFKMDETAPAKQELEAFDRVMAEILGTPVAGQVVSAGASNMQLLVTLQRLGGLVFTQTAETFNMIHHLGLRSVLSGMSDLPRILGEVGRLKKGDASGNHILTSIEAYGGEIGTESYKMIAPLDAPDGRLGEYIDQPGVASRLMRAGGHLQSKISGFRGLLAAQHRMVAEQIVIKAARFIRDGKDSVALRDMGFTPEVAEAMRPELKRIAEWDGNDRITAFDLTRVSDPRIAEAFVQAVHRGTSQIIQGTFIGERNKWFHNDYMKLLLQLRTFGLTATEKQWGRTRMNHGYTYAAGMLMGQMALALPIHAARVQLMAAGRDDREKYIKDSMNPAALARAVMNYSSLSGVSGDVLEILSGVAGGWGGKATQELVGARQQSTSVGRIVPVAGSIDTLARMASGKTDLHTALKQLPFSNLWYVVPAINLTKHK